MMESTWRSRNVERHRKTARTSYRRNLQYQRERSSEQYYKNRDAILEKRRLDRIADPEKYRSYRLNNIENRRKCSRQWRQAHLVECRVRYKQWVESNRETRRLSMRRGSASRRARKCLAFIEIVDPLIIYVRDKGVCGICHRRVSCEAFHVDHIVPLVKGGKHSYENTQLTHPRCNLLKGIKIEC